MLTVSLPQKTISLLYCNVINWLLLDINMQYPAIRVPTCLHGLRRTVDQDCTPQVDPLAVCTRLSPLLCTCGASLSWMPLINPVPSEPSSYRSHCLVGLEWLISPNMSRVPRRADKPKNKLAAQNPTDVASLFNLNANLESWKTNTM